MFDQLSGRLGAAVAALRGRGRLTEDNTRDALREVGWLAAKLEYAQIDQILDLENPSLEQLLGDFNAVGAAVYRAYFSN